MYNPNLHFHFTGIGGSGMSGLAEILLAHGFRVSGSDIKDSPLCERLRECGAKVQIGHAAENLPTEASLLVYSSAVNGSNPELMEARQRGIPLVRRAEVLAELMRLKFGVAVAGSHGKTTTTSMIAAVLEGAELDPTVVIGGQLKSSFSGSRLGRSQFLVAESDESDRSFLLLKPTIAVVTNIDNEHICAYGSMRELEESFESFLSAVPFYGLAVLGIDDARVRSLAGKFSGRKVTYGMVPDAAIRAEDITLGIGKTEFAVCAGSEKPVRVCLPVIGRHLAVNSLAAFAVGREFGVASEVIAEALRTFSGVCRRTEIMGCVGGVTVVNDYGHHPTEIRATINAVKEAWRGSLRSLHVVFQPHRYSRTHDCFAEFIDAFHDCDTLTCTDIYAAGEEPIAGISGELLLKAISHPDKTFVQELSTVPQLLMRRVSAGDVVLCLGAGSIGGLPERILSRLAESSLKDSKLPVNLQAGSSPEARRPGAYVA